ncbi:MAG: hypothetical protein AAF219_03320 [Myxococcota bacterium]
MQTMVILSPKPTTTLDAFGPLLVEEEKKLWEYQTQGQCRSIHYHGAKPGHIVLQFETSDIAEAERLVQGFPFVKAGLFDVEIIPLVPYQGLAALFGEEHSIEVRLPDSWRATEATD